jgi:hypothetical protein
MTSNPEETPDAQMGTPPSEPSDPAPEGAGNTSPEATGEPEPVGDRQGRRYAQTRTRLKEVSAERDTLASRVLNYQRADVERIASEHIARPELIWDNGLALEDVVDPDTGTVDTEAVTEAVQQIADRLRGALPPPAHHADIGAKSTSTSKPAASWGAVVRGR